MTATAEALLRIALFGDSVFAGYGLLQERQPATRLHERLRVEGIVAEMMPAGVGEVLAMMLTLTDNGTMLVVTHEMSFAREVADRIVYMDGGKILADGSPAEILDAPDDPRIQQFMRRLTER